MDIREVAPADSGLLRRHWEISKAAADASRPFDFHQAWDTFRLMSALRRDDLEVVLLGAFVDGVMLGAARIDLQLLDNVHAAHGFVYVHPDRQREGIGRALAQASYDVAVSRGRRLMMTETYAPVEDTSAGLLFAEAIGFETALVDGIKVVDLPATEHRWDVLAAKAAPEHADYRIATWRGSVPDELVPGYCRLNELFLEEAPMGELGVEAERWDVDRVRSRERRNAHVGRHDLCAGAVAPDGTLVAMTEVGVDVHAPHWGFQSGTIVAPEHRGNRLGLAVKLANHRQVRERFPACRVLMTGNADVNAPMNAINDALGYGEVERCIEMQRVI